MTIRIAVDAMGGNGPKVTVAACLDILKTHPDIQINLFGDEASIKSQAATFPDTLNIFHADESILDEDTVATALKQKKQSSMRLALNSVKEGVSDCCVSAGNTGVLMAMSRYVLKMLPGVSRPAICAVLPTMDTKKHIRMLDLGANVEASSDVLLQFAVIGSRLSELVDGIGKPKVALLNIGEEHHKGNDTIKHAAHLLKEHPLINYVGFVEPNYIFKGDVDVVVCDGLLGNVALKSIEGTSKLIKSYLKNAFTANLLTKVIALIATPVLNRIAKDMSTSSRNGASLVGLNATVIKSHGGANRKGFAQAIKNAYHEAIRSIPEQVKSGLKTEE